MKNKQNRMEFYFSFTFNTGIRVGFHYLLLTHNKFQEDIIFQYVAVQKLFDIVHFWIC